MTLANKVIESLQAAAKVNRAVQTPPALIMWTDKERHWETVATGLGARLPSLLTLGAFDAAQRTGPARLFGLNARWRAEPKTWTLTGKPPFFIYPALAALTCAPSRPAPETCSPWPSCNTGAFFGARPMVKTGR